MLAQFGGFAKVTKWFTSFGVLKRENHELEGANGDLAQKLESLGLRFDYKVADEVERQIAQYKSVYGAKCDQVRVLEQRLYGDSPAPKGP